MAHGVWRNWLERYAEGELPWPLTRWVEAHTRRCHTCRQELQAQLALLAALDRTLLAPAELAGTVSRVVAREVAAAERRHSRQRGATLPWGRRLALVGAGAALLLLWGVWPSGRQGGWERASPLVAASSSWGEGDAVSVPLEAAPVTLLSSVAQGEGKVATADHADWQARKASPLVLTSGSGGGVGRGGPVWPARR